jgi:hypothetical protein
MIVVRLKHVLVSLTLLAFSACADTTPLPFAGSDAGAGDAGQVPPAVIEACRQCTHAEGALCRPAYDQCAVDPRCLAFMTCVLETGCLAAGELQNRITCAEPCFRSTGIQAGVDPSLERALPWNACTLPTGPCGSACVIE